MFVNTTSLLGKRFSPRSRGWWATLRWFMCCCIHGSLRWVSALLELKNYVRAVTYVIGDVKGGEVTYSNSDDGLWSKHSNYNHKFKPPHNSCYMFFGSFVQHAVSSVKSGTRISIVFFFQPKISFKLLVYMWGKKPEQCPSCYRLFSERKNLLRHRRDWCTETIAFDRFKQGKFFVEEEDSSQSDWLTIVVILPCCPC